LTESRSECNQQFIERLAASQCPVSGFCRIEGGFRASQAADSVGDIECTAPVVMQCVGMHRLKQQLQQLAITFLGLSVLTACTVQPARLPSGSIPISAATTVLEDEHVDEVIGDLSEEYPLDNSSQHYYEMLHLLSQLAVAAGTRPDDWQIYLFDAPDIVDVRAIRGNTLFVWSGIFDVVGDQDELAGLLACEMAHVLARHTDPVEFNLGSELMFGVTDIAASIGIMILTQGIVAVSGSGMTRWLYVEASDLDELDRVYDEQQVEEMAEIALLILAGSEYAPAGLLQFWQRAGSAPGLSARLKRLSRQLSPGERVAVLESAMTVLPADNEDTVPGDELASLTME
jgi:Zn-dependent protease with chaperone function